MPQVSAELLRAARALGEALKQTPPLRTYANAMAILDADKQATALLDELQRAQAAMRVKQANGGMTRDDIARLRELQDAAPRNPAIAAFIAAEQDAQAYLPQVNQALSEQLGIDFAVMGRRSNC
jgi:cell fate (sporulation/competence/biofilm development) regulator YlbF (YheA/YmcA/DUF963 family)